MQQGVWVSMLVVLSLLGCGRARFRAACESLHPGQTLDTVKIRLESVGGRYMGRLQQGHQWMRPWGFLRASTCTIEDGLPAPVTPADPRIPPDPHVVVTGVRFNEGDVIP